MLVGCGVCATGVTYSPEEKPNILDVLVLMLEKGYLSTDLKAHIESYIKEYKEAKKKYNGLGSNGIIVIKAFVEARDNLEKIKADILSDQNKTKAFVEARDNREKIKADISEVQQEIIDNKYTYNPLLLETDLPECIRLYITALEGLKAAKKELILSYISEDDLRSPIANCTYNCINSTSFLQDQIAIYDRFIKAKNELEKCLYTAQLAAASQNMHQTLAPESYPPSQT